MTPQVNFIIRLILERSKPNSRQFLEASDTSETTPFCSATCQAELWRWSRVGPPSSATAGSLTSGSFEWPFLLSWLGLATHPSSTHRRMSCTRRSPASALAARGQLDIPPRFSSVPPCLLSCCLREARIYLVNSESLMEEPDLGRLLWNLALTEKTKGGRMGTQPGRSQLRGQGRRSLPPGPHSHSPHQAFNGLGPPQPPPDASSALFLRFPNKWLKFVKMF